MQLDAAARELLDYGATPFASRQIDRCVVKFPMGKDRIAEQDNKEREIEKERVRGQQHSLVSYIQLTLILISAYIQFHSLPKISCLQKFLS